MADPFSLIGRSKEERKKAMERRVYALPNQPLDKGGVVQKFFGLSEEAKEAKTRRGLINEDFRKQRRDTREEWRKEDKLVQEQDRRQMEDLKRYYGIYKYEPGTPQWEDANKRIEEKFARYKKDMKRDTYDKRNQQMRDLQRQRDKSVTEMWKVLRSAGEGDAPRGERLI